MEVEVKKEKILQDFIVTLIRSMRNSMETVIWTQGIKQKLKIKYFIYTFFVEIKTFLSSNLPLISTLPFSPLLTVVKVNAIVLIRFYFKLYIFYNIVQKSS